MGTDFFFESLEVLVHGLPRLAHDIRYLLLAHVVKVMAYDDPLGLGRDVVQEDQELVELAELGRIVAFSHAHDMTVILQELPPMPGIAYVVEAKICADAMEPGHPARLGAKVASLGKEPDKDLLRRISGLVRIRQELAAVPLDLEPVASIHGFNSTAI